MERESYMSKKTKKMLIILVVIMSLIIVLVLIQQEKKKQQDQLEDLKREPYRELFLDYFYKDESIISKGKLFDMRYLHYDYNSLFGNSIEIIQRGDISIFDVKTRVVLKNGDRVDVYFDTYGVPAPYIGDRYFYNERIYAPYLNRINKVGTRDSVFYEEQIDLNDFVLEIEYKGNVEVHHLVYDDKQIEKMFVDFFKDYLDDKIEYNAWTEKWISDYYDYNSLLMRHNNQGVQEFAYKVWEVYTKEDEVDMYSALVTSIFHDYFNLGYLNENNVQDSEERLKNLLQENKRSINEFPKVREGYLYQVASCLSYYSEYDDRIDDDAGNKGQDILFDKEWNDKSITKEMFWDYIERYLINIS